MTNHTSIVITTDDLRRWLDRFCTLLEDNTELLTRLDSAIGDADHGANMERGVESIRQAIADASITTPGALLELVGDAVLEGIGGAAGPLYASIFLGAAPVCGDDERLTLRVFAASVDAGVTALAARGRAELSDKTMYDAAHPAAAALCLAADHGEDGLVTCLAAAVTAATLGRDATRPLQARKGRASYLGPRSIGHIDPGAASVTLLFEAMRAMGEEGRP